MKIYVEWIINGAFENAFFHSWEAFRKATFSPDCTILAVKVFAEGRRERA